MDYNLHYNWVKKYYKCSDLYVKWSNILVEISALKIVYKKKQELLIYNPPNGISATDPQKLRV